MNSYANEKLCEFDSRFAKLFVQKNAKQIPANSASERTIGKSWVTKSRSYTHEKSWKLRHVFKTPSLRKVIFLGIDQELMVAVDLITR